MNDTEQANSRDSCGLPQRAQGQPEGSPSSGAAADGTVGTATSGRVSIVRDELPGAGGVVLATRQYSEHRPYLTARREALFGIDHLRVTAEEPAVDVGGEPGAVRIQADGTGGGPVVAQVGFDPCGQSR